jgi:hypothetical protein
MSNGIPWMPEMDARLKELHAAGDSFSVMAQKLSTPERPVTKNMCIGRALRLGLPGRKQPAPPVTPHEPTRNPFPAAHRCLWPIGNPADAAHFRFCGAKVAVLGEPYCPQHRALAYLRPGRAAEAA